MHYIHFQKWDKSHTFKIYVINSKFVRGKKMHLIVIKDIM